MWHKNIFFLLQHIQNYKECALSGEMQIGANSLTITLILDLLNPKSISCDTVTQCQDSRTTTVPSFKSFRSGVFVLHTETQTPTQIHTNPHTHIMTKSSQYRRRVLAVGADNYNRCTRRAQTSVKAAFNSFSLRSASLRIFGL